MELPNIDDLIQRYLAGESPNDLAKDCGVSVYILCSRMKARGVKLRTKQESYMVRRKRTSRLFLTLPVEEIVQRYLAGEGAASLGRIYSVDGSTIRYVLEKSKVKLRTRSEAEVVKNSRMTSEQRRARARAASASCRGRPKALAHRIAIANTRSRKRSPNEAALAACLRSLEIPIQTQVPVGPYNVDIALHGTTIAVEVENGWPMPDCFKSKVTKRLKYLFDRGWCVLYVIGTKFDAPQVAEKVLTWFDRARRNKAFCGKYGMIDCRGQIRGRRSDLIKYTKLDGFSRVKGF